MKGIPGTYLMKVIPGTRRDHQIHPEAFAIITVDLDVKKQTGV